MKKGLSLKNIILGAVALVGIIATFLPWATVSFLGISATVNGVSDGQTDGWFTLLAFVAVAVLAGVFIQKEKMHIGASIGITVAGAIAFIVGLKDIIDINANSLGMGSAGIGLWLVVIAGIAAAVLPWIPLKNMVGGPAKK